MTAYTSTGDGNWNDNATWGGGGYPASSADTATIAAGHEVTIPSGVTIDCGAITLNAGVSAANKTKLIITDGRLNMNGTVTTNTNSCFNLNGAAYLDFKGNALTMAGDTELNWLGTENARATITSSVGNGTMTGGAYPTRGNHRYCDVSNLANPIFGRTHTSAIRITVLHCTFTNMTGTLAFDSTGTSGAAEYDIGYNTFSSPADANPTTATAAQPSFNNQTALTPGTYRQFYNNVFYQPSRTATAAGVTFMRCTGLTLRDNVTYNWKLSPQGRTADVGALMQFINNVFILDSSDPAQGGEWFYQSSIDWCNPQHNYWYTNSGNHPIPLWGASVNNDTWSCNIFDGIDAPIGINWLLRGTDAITRTSTCRNMLCLGSGNLLAHTGNLTGGPNLEYKLNTLYMNNGGDTSENFATLLILEQSVTTFTSGACRILNNLWVDSASADADFVVTASPTSSVAADAIEYMDYNASWGLSPSQALSPVWKCGAEIVMTGGYGANDISVAPDFVDNTRSIRSFDALMGGTGTAANAFAQFVARAPGYTPKALCDYVWEGFKFRATELRGVGENGANIGACNFQDDTRNLATATAITSYLTSAYQ